MVMISSRSVSIHVAQELCEQSRDRAKHQQDRIEQIRKEAQPEDRIGRDRVCPLLEDALGDDLSEHPDEGRGDEYGDPTALLTEEVDHQRRHHGGIGDHRDIGADQRRR
jgi:hypothetical protein